MHSVLPHPIKQRGHCSPCGTHKKLWLDASRSLCRTSQHSFGQHLVTSSLGSILQPSLFLHFPAMSLEGELTLVLLPFKIKGASFTKVYTIQYWLPCSLDQETRQRETKRTKHGAHFRPIPSIRLFLYANNKHKGDQAVPDYVILAPQVAEARGSQV